MYVAVFHVSNLYVCFWFAVLDTISTLQATLLTMSNRQIPMYTLTAWSQLSKQTASSISSSWSSPRKVCSLQCVPGMISWHSSPLQKWGTLASWPIPQGWIRCSSMLQGVVGYHACQVACLDWRQWLTYYFVCNCFYKCVYLAFLTARESNAVILYWVLVKTCGCIFGGELAGRRIPYLAARCVFIVFWIGHVVTWTALASLGLCLETERLIYAPE